jgi:hypothetical protein
MKLQVLMVGGGPQEHALKAQAATAGMAERNWTASVARYRDVYARALGSRDRTAPVEA